MLNYTTFFSKEGAEWVVFLHGIGGGSGIWIKQIRDFKKQFNLLLIDLPGHGDSLYGLDDMVEPSFSKISEEVLKVLDQENIRKAHFVGISLGTIIVQSLHDTAPERVSSMILGGAVEKFNLTAKAIINIANTVKHLLPYMWLYKLCAFILMPKKHHKEARLSFVKEAYKLGRKEFLHWYKLHRQVESTVKQAKSKALNVPKLYIMGSEDYMFLPAIKQSVCRTKQEMLHIIERCGHVCNIERHKEFNEKALMFLTSMKKESTIA